MAHWTTSHIPGNIIQEQTHEYKKITIEHILQFNIQGQCQNIKFFIYSQFPKNSFSFLMTLFVISIASLQL